MSHVPHRVNHVSPLTAGIGGACAVAAAFLAASAALFPASSIAATAPVVQTSLGAVSGKLLNGTRSFLGIPYAEPPTGPLRWQPPQPVAGWKSIRPATAGGPPCAQPKNVVGDASANEDCLYLNVQVPDDVAEGEQLPVMVWLHGGGFLTGWGSLYDLSRMAHKGRVVMVSLNYRLGAFGFFRLPGEAAPVNFGLMDQQAALRWVKNEIGRFGGDASRVTLFGQSAGGAAACTHMVSPGSAGLFHRVIMQSGLCTPVGSPSTARLEAASARLAEAIGCPAGADQMACLREKPSAEVLSASAATGSVFDTGGLRWAPVPDGVTLPGDPAQLVREGRFKRVPMIVGTNHDEGRFFVAMDYHLKTLLPVSTRQMNDAYARAAEGDAAFAATLAGVYTAKAYGSRDKALGALLTDVLSSCKSMKRMEEMARHTPIYAYEFREPNTPGMFDPYMAMGAFHAVELRYLFQVKLAGPTLNLALSKAQQKLADTMVGYWASFAAGGEPEVPGAPAWPRFSPSVPSVLSLTSSAIDVFDAASFKADHQCDVWGDRGPQ